MGLHQSMISYVKAFNTHFASDVTYGRTLNTYLHPPNLLQAARVRYPTIVKIMVRLNTRDCDAAHEWKRAEIIICFNPMDKRRWIDTSRPVSLWNPRIPRYSEIGVRSDKGDDARKAMAFLQDTGLVQLSDWLVSWRQVD
jgi:hypothetical protein